MVKFTKNCFLAASVFYFSLSSFSFAMEDDGYSEIPDLHTRVNINTKYTNGYGTMPELQNTSSIQISNPLINTNDPIQNPSIDSVSKKNDQPMPESYDAKLHQEAAKQGDAKAQFNLGVMYENGRGEKKNKKEAAKWCQEAAEQGLAEAQYDLGVMYRTGRGVEEDRWKAVKLYRMAADQGHAKAQFNLGVMYENGRGKMKDETEAAKWYRMAAEKGLAEAQFNLGVVLANGRGVEKNEKEAVKWFQEAADQGHAKAENLVKKLKKKLKII